MEQINKQTINLEKKGVNGKKRIAKALLEEQEDITRIAKITGLSIKQIKSL